MTTNPSCRKGIVVAPIAEAPGAHVHHVSGVTVTAAGQPRLSVWPSDQAGRGMVLTYGFFPEPWVQTQPEELAAASEVLSLQQE